MKIVNGEVEFDIKFFYLMFLVFIIGFCLGVKYCDNLWGGLHDGGTISKPNRISHNHNGVHDNDIHSSAVAAFLATAYCDRGTTATGIQAGPGVVAVDPRVIPLHTVVTYAGYRYRAEDTGGLIKGHRVDLWEPSCARALAFGVRRIWVTL